MKIGDRIIIAKDIRKNSFPKGCRGIIVSINEDGEYTVRLDNRKFMIEVSPYSNIIEAIKYDPS
jgi:hypothetical protein